MKKREKKSSMKEKKEKKRFSLKIQNAFVIRVLRTGKTRERE